MRSKSSKFWWILTHGRSASRPWDPALTPEEEYYRSEEHFHEMPYKIGDLLPPTWGMHAAYPLHGTIGWPSYGRPIIYRGSDPCPICAGRGIILYGAYAGSSSSGGYHVFDNHVLAEKYCDFCNHTGYAKARALATARANGYSTVEEYVAAVHAQRAMERAKKRKEIEESKRAERLKRGGWAGWLDAERLFAPVHDYLHDEDKVMDWLYKARALIGAAILVAVGVHYHQPTISIAANFSAILGGISEPLILAVFSVVPATALVVLFTRPGKRKVAFDQMMRYPAKIILICLVAYGLVRGYEHLFFGTSNILVYFALAIVGAILLRWILFWFRAIYLVTVGMCRLGDGHPLLPPIIGAAIVWVVACQTLSNGHTGSSEPAVISYAVLLGGPISITALGIVEILRLRTKYPDDFPFRDGPLPANR